MKEYTSVQQGMKEEQPFPTILLYGHLVSPNLILIKHECLTFACFLIDILLHFILFSLKKDLLSHQSDSVRRCCIIVNILI